MKRTILRGAIPVLLFMTCLAAENLFAKITLTGTGTSTSSNFLYGTSGYVYSRLGAQARAFDELNRQARKNCPDGYRIASGPFETTTTSSSWSGGWLTYTSVCNASVVIECDSTLAKRPDHEKYPSIDPRDAQPPPPLDTKEMRSKLEEHRSELLKISDAGQLVRFVEKNKVEGVDYGPFHRAVDAGEVTRIAVPTVEEFIRSRLDDIPTRLMEQKKGGGR